MRQTLPRVLAGVILVVVVGYFLVSSRSNRNTAYPTRGATAAPAGSSGSFSGQTDKQVEAAKAVVYAMLDAAAKGDVRAYVRCFGGEKAKEIEALIGERGEPTFAEALRRTNAQVKGIVLHGAEVLSKSRIRIKCELLFIDHNEMNELTLESGRGGWRITGLNPMGSFQMVRPYGSLVYPVIQETPAEGAAPGESGESASQPAAGEGP